MTTAFRLVQAAIVTALTTPPDIVGTRVEAGRERPLAAEDPSDIVVSLGPIAGQAITLSGAPTDWQVPIDIEIRTRGTPSLDAGGVADPILQAAYARIAATRPPAGVMAWDLRPRVEIDLDEAATNLASVRFGLVAHLRTLPGSLEIAA